MFLRLVCGVRRRTPVLVSASDVRRKCSFFFLPCHSPRVKDLRPFSFAGPSSSFFLVPLVLPLASRFLSSFAARAQPNRTQQHANSTKGGADLVRL